MTQIEASEGKNEGGSAVPRPKVLNYHPPIKAAHTDKWYIFNIGEITFQYPKARTTFEANLYKKNNEIWLQHLLVSIDGHYSHMIYMGRNTIITF